VFKEIRRCLRLSGGVMHQGIKWIWKAAVELAELLGCNEKTIRGDLAALVRLGWLKREKLQRKWGWQVYHYTLGDQAPLKPKPHESGHQAHPDAGGAPASISSRSTIQKNHHQPRAASRPTASKQPRTEKGSPAVKVADAEGRPLAIPVPAHWPEPEAQATALAIENLRNSIPLLRRGARGFDLREAQQSRDFRESTKRPEVN
jgi:hypothetical protein